MFSICSLSLLKLNNYHVVILVGINQYYIGFGGEGDFYLDCWSLAIFQNKLFRGILIIFFNFLHFNDFFFVA
jgi:hypothetical protein